jgi:hypothetical protein
VAAKAEVKGPPAAGPSGKSVAGIVVGAFVGTIGSVLGALVMFAALSGTYPSGGTCQRNIGAGIGEAAAIIGLGVLAWYLLFRVKGDSFWLGFARGLVVSVTLMMLIPWPCSLGFWAAQSLTCFAN